MTFKSLLYSLASLVLLCACTEKTDEPGGRQQPESGKYSLSGKVEKGPFVRGSSISVQPLNASFAATGTIFEGEIADNTGTFDLGEIELESQFVRLSADGYYFNEVTGDYSSGTLHLTAYADLSDRTTVNVNILTHLKAARIQKLVAGGMSFAQADRQAQKELLTQFGLQAYESSPAENMTIAAGTDGSGVLIAISSLILADRTDAEITQYLSALSQDLADDGEFTEANKTAVRQSLNKVAKDLDQISWHVSAYYNLFDISVSVPDLRYFFDWDNDGIAGNEINDNVEVTLSRTEVAFDHNGGTAAITVTSNVPLSLEKNVDTDDMLPEQPVLGTVFDRFFIDEGKPINYDCTLEDKVLNITVAKSEKRYQQAVTIPLYDMMGVCQATVEITLAANPEIELKLADTGRQMVSDTFARFAKAISWMYYIERGYTGMYQYYDVACPLEPYGRYNRSAFAAAYSSLSQNTYIYKNLQAYGYTDATPFFRLLNAIVYTEMVDKWGVIGITETREDEFSVPAQQEADYTLRYLEAQLLELSDAFKDKKAESYLDTADQAFNMSKDVWRIALANIYMALKQYSKAMTILEQIVDSHSYSLYPGNEYEPNDGMILHLIVPDEVMSGHTIGYYTYADVLLSLAECNIATGNTAKATALIRQVADAKSLAVSGNNIDDIAALRKSLFLPRYFAFQKRNNLGGYQTCQNLWPIPADQLDRAPGWTQNPGY